MNISGLKYVSVFKINGTPIPLPPMMTTEKRFEMQMYREKAIQLERKIVKEKHSKSVSYSEMKSDGLITSQRCLGGDGDFGIKNNFKENAMKATTSRSENSDMEGHKAKLVDSATNTVDDHCESEVKDRMMKLSKTKTICFDNTTNAIVRGLTDEEFAQLTGKSPECQKVYICELINGSNLEAFLLQNSNENKMIPAIQVEPPTPSVDSRPSEISSPRSITVSIESNDAIGSVLSEAMGNDMVASTEGSIEGSLENLSLSPMKIRDEKGAARELNFDINLNISNNSSPVLQSKSDPDVNSPEDNSNLRSTHRSATSPSLKSMCDTIGSCSLVSSPRVNNSNSAYAPIVRSNSFTLLTPSKALLDHIQEQNRQKASNRSNSCKRSKVATVRVASKQRSTPSPSARRDTVESKAKRVPKKTETKTTARSTSAARAKQKTSFNNYASNATLLWNNPLPPVKLKRSPYDAKGLPASNNKPNLKIANNANKFSNNKNVKKSSSSTTYTIKEMPSRISLPDNANSTDVTSDTTTISMAEIEYRHRQKLLDLIAQQQQEQRRLQQMFEVQQKMLLEQLQKENVNQYCSDGNTLHIEGVSRLSPMSGYPMNANQMFGGSTSFMTPCLTGMFAGYASTSSASCGMPMNMHPSPIEARATLESSVEVVGLSTPVYMNTSSFNGCTNEFISSTMENTQPQKPPEQQSQQDFSDAESNKDSKLNAAATIINACVRGFLVRRLFQTEQIQRIVQTIKDTLIFVLKLHMETMENPEEANTESNIKLKARLLQQLSSAIRTLHLIFFQTTIKERMEIIARDRKRIKTKLLSKSLKRSPRIA